jgi:hypothetical protein
MQNDNGSPPSGTKAERKLEASEHAPLPILGDIEGRLMEMANIVAYTRETDREMKAYLRRGEEKMEV